MICTQLLDIAEDRWMSGAMGYAVFRVSRAVTDEDACGLADRVPEELEQHARCRGRSLYYARIDTRHVAWLHALNAAGMLPVDVSVTLELPGMAAAPRGEDFDGLRLRDARPDDAGPLLRIASSSFQYSRLHLDPKVPAALANRVRQAWVESYLAGRRGDRLFVAERDGHVAGFLAAVVHETGGQRIVVLDLMGVSVADQRCGIGRALVRHWVRCYQPSCQLLRIGTQAANLPALRLYESCGFLTAGTSYVLHLHVE